LQSSPREILNEEAVAAEEVIFAVPMIAAAFSVAEGDIPLAEAERTSFHPPVEEEVVAAVAHFGIVVAAEVCLSWCDRH
jgi:hypothetical protein